MPGKIISMPFDFAVKHGAYNQIFLFSLSQKSLQSTIYLPIPCVAFWFRFLKAPDRRLLFAFTMCNNAWCMACQSQLKDIFIPFCYVLYDHHYNNI